jgi:hypothetical protein
MYYEAFDVGKQWFKFEQPIYNIKHIVDEHIHILNSSTYGYLLCFKRVASFARILRMQ